MEGYDVDSSKFPSVKIPRFVSSRTPSATRRWQENNGAIYNLEGCLLDLDLHTDANNFAPNESERLSISLALLFTKDQTHGGNSDGDCTERKQSSK